MPCRSGAAKRKSTSRSAQILRLPMRPWLNFPRAFNLHVDGDGPAQSGLLLPRHSGQSGPHVPRALPGRSDPGSSADDEADAKAQACARQARQPAANAPEALARKSVLRMISEGGNQVGDPSINEGVHLYLRLRAHCRHPAWFSLIVAEHFATREANRIPGASALSLPSLRTPVFLEGIMLPAWA